MFAIHRCPVLPPDLHGLGRAYKLCHLHAPISGSLGVDLDSAPSDSEVGRQRRHAPLLSERSLVWSTVTDDVSPSLTTVLPRCNNRGDYAETRYRDHLGLTSRNSQPWKMSIRRFNRQDITIYFIWSSSSTRKNMCLSL